MDRNRDFYYPDGNKPGHYKCEICQLETNRSSAFINSHIVAHCYAKTLKTARATNKRLPTSPSYVCNGLFLCRICDDHFEDHSVIIAGDGTITVRDDDLRSKEVYKKLHGKIVPWASEIDSNVDWPTSETLNYRNTLPPVIGNHRKLDYGVDEDDKSTASESEDAENVVVQTRGNKKRALGGSDTTAVRTKKARKH
jgi:hypothetical protein